MNMNPKLVRSLLAFLAIGFTTPAIAQTTRSAPPPSSYPTVRLGPLVGLEFANGDTGLALRGDASMPLSRLSPTASLDGVLSVGFSWFSQGNVDTTIFKLIPALRLTVPITPTVGFYGDVGLGFYYGSESIGAAGFGNDYAEDSGAGVGMRFAGGLFADVAPAVRIGGELGVNPYFGQFDETTVSLMFSVMFRL